MVGSRTHSAMRKAAILVSVLDRRSADALLDRIAPEQADRLRDAVLRLGDVSDEEQQAVLREFLRQGSEVDAGVELDRSLARRLSSGSTEPPIDVADPAPPQSRPFRTLQLAAPESLAQHLRHEHPQITAVVLAHLPPERSAEVIKRLPERLQVDVLRRVAELDRADPQVLRDLEFELEQRLSAEIRAAKNRSAGLSAVASILAAAGSDRGSIVRTVVRHDEQFSSLLSVETLASTPDKKEAEQPPAAELPARQSADQAATGKSEGPTPVKTSLDSPREELLSFEELELLDDRGLASLFASAEAELTLVALSGADDSLTFRITSQLPPKQARQFRKSIQRLGPLRLSDIEHAQQEIARLATRMVAEGLISPPAVGRWTAAA